MTIVELFDDVWARCNREAYMAKGFTQTLEEAQMMVPITVVEDVVKQMEEKCIELSTSKPIKKFMFVEDGSIDDYELLNELEARNPDIKMILYRQGSARPTLVNVDGSED